MPSRAAARSIWDDSAREAYRGAAQQIRAPYKGCVKVNGSLATVDGNCMKKVATGFGEQLRSTWSG